MTILQTIHQHTIKIIRTDSRKPKKVGTLLKELGLLGKGDQYDSTL